jgi:bifunctional ADP-heptose synthase (sugar kinase/adenylyltransferase)
MNPRLGQLIDAFSGLRVAVLGDAMLDSYLEGTSGRLCREVPVPNVRLNARSDVPGGAANVAVNLRALGSRPAGKPHTVVVDSRRRLAAFRKIGVTAAKPNYQEAVELLGERPIDSPEARTGQITGQAERVLERTGARIAAVTLDQEGALLIERGRPPYRTYAGPIRPSCVAGAGDTFVSALTLALLAGASSPAAADLASAAAAVVVGKQGTAVCSARELRECIFVEVSISPNCSGWLRAWTTTGSRAGASSLPTAASTFCIAATSLF